jgi:asparagine synthetase A
LQEYLVGKSGAYLDFDRDEMMTQTKHGRGRHDFDAANGIVTVQDGHAHRREQDALEDGESIYTQQSTRDYVVRTKSRSTLILHAMPTVRT